MAFHQPTLPPPKQAAVVREPRPRPANIVVQRALEDSQEWVLFSPSQAQASPALSGEHTSRTAGLSRLSDFGSLNTIGRTENEEALEDDELDSLDDGLHAFREPSIAHVQRRLDQSGGSILPAHDGLGTFAPNSREVQEQLWQHERFNPRRRTYTHHRTSSSVQQRLEALDEEVAAEPLLLDDLRLERIQKWRFEQSVLAEHPNEQQHAKPQDSPKDASLRVVATQATADLPGSDEPSSLWERITRTVIQNIIGIDETLLSVILGESLIEESRKGLDTVLEVPAQDPLSTQELSASNEWEARLIRRIARELGHLVKSLSSPTRSLTSALDPLSMDYAGIPVVEPAASREMPSAVLSGDPFADSAAFHPTLKHHHGAGTAADDLWSDDGRFSEREYWEQTPTLRSVFSYLTRRFLSQQQQQSQQPREPAASPNNLATAPSPASLHRAAVIQQHHPLVLSTRSRATAAAHERRHLRRGSALRPPSLRHNQQRPGSLKRGATSCASWSTKRSRLGDLASEGGSRHYWDLGGSLGSESLVLAGVGHWGEV